MYFQAIVTLREKFSSRRAWLPRGARTDGLGVGPERAVFDIHFIFFSGSFVYYLTCVFLNPTSPLGLGGLECGVSFFNPSFFDHSGFNPLGRGLPLPLGSLSEGRAPTPRDALGFLIAFLCHLLRFIFHHFRCRFFVAS